MQEDLTAHGIACLAMPFCFAIVTVPFITMKQKHAKIIFEQLSFYSDTKTNRSPYNRSEKKKECALQAREYVPAKPIFFF
ncbi:MAG: hypothetical protein ACOX0U_02790 [Oscillospiraceae bacterium]|jgi:hypothetical protein